MPMPSTNLAFEQTPVFTSPAMTSRKSAVTPSTSQAYLPCANKKIHTKYDEEGEGVNFGSDSTGMEEKPDAQKPGLRKPTPP